MPEITFDSAVQLESEILITVTVDGVQARKCVPLDSDLKSEAEKLVAEVLAPVEEEKPQPKPIPVDVSGIVLEVS